MPTSDGRTTPSQIEIDAARREFSEIVEYLEEHVGESVAAYLSGLEDRNSVGEWARGTSKPHDLASLRLRGEPPALEVDGTTVMPEALADPRPLLVGTEKSLRSARLDNDGLVSGRAKRALRGRLVPTSIERALRTLEGLVKDPVGDRRGARGSAVEHRRA